MGVDVAVAVSRALNAKERPSIAVRAASTASIGVSLTSFMLMFRSRKDKVEKSSLCSRY